MISFRCLGVVTLCFAIGNPTFSLGQDQPSPAPKYKITVIDNASTAKRAKKGRVSAEAVVKVTDQNDLPVSGVAVLFAIPHLTSGSASFAAGALTSSVTTNAAGIATSSTFVAAHATFAISVTATVPGATITASVPVSTAALAAAAGGAAGAAGAGAGAGAGGAAAGISAGVIGGIVAGVAAAAVGIAVALKGGSSSSNSTTPPTTATGSIGVGSGPTVGAPH